MNLSAVWQQQKIPENKADWYTFGFSRRKSPLTARTVDTEPLWGCRGSDGQNGRIFRLRRRQRFCRMTSRLRCCSSVGFWSQGGLWRPANSSSDDVGLHRSSQKRASPFGFLISRRRRPNKWLQKYEDCSRYTGWDILHGGASDSGYTVGERGAMLVPVTSVV